MLLLCNARQVFADALKVNHTITDPTLFASSSDVLMELGGALHANGTIILLHVASEGHTHWQR